MPPLNDEQLDQRRDERREQIKRAAVKVFARRGLVGTKMSMIAAEAGISQGLSYRYFATKDDLFVELVREAMVASQAAVAQVGDLPGTPLEQLRTLTQAMLDEDNRHLFLLVQQVQTSDEVPEAARQLVGRYSASSLIEPLVPILLRGQASGDFCPGDPRELLACYLAVVTGLMLQHMPAEGEVRMPRIDLLLKILQ